VKTHHGRFDRSLTDGTSQLALKSSYVERTLPVLSFVDISIALRNYPDPAIARSGDGRPIAI